MSWCSKESSTDSHNLQASADSLLDIFSQSHVRVPRFITNSVMQVLLLSILFNYQTSKFHSLRKPKIKYRVQNASHWSVPEIGCFCILHSV
jgi:hypothetical protein